MQSEFVDGLAYLEVGAIYAVNKNQVPLVSKAGFPMRSIVWNVTDSRGNTGKIYEYVMKSAMWKIMNIQNATGVHNFYNEKTEKFNEEALVGARCGGSIALDELSTFGHKVKMYVPLEFYRMVTNPETIGEAVNSVKKNDEPANSASTQGQSRQTVTIADTIDFDDGIPF